MRAIEQLVTEIRAERERCGAADGGFLEQIHASYAELARPARDVAVARDVIMLHLGSQSNLYAALAWTLVNVVTRPELVDAIRSGDDLLLERCARESIRMAQRSLTLRRVMHQPAPAGG